MNTSRIIPAIDLFAGPGGLNEGFSYNDGTGLRFKSVLSIEKDIHAYHTLELRAFFRYFGYHQQDVPDEYYAYVNGMISKETLFARFKGAADAARQEAYKATLGTDEKGNKGTPDTEIQQRITKALNGVKNWLLIGGPPCQAYSLVGRSRTLGGIKSQGLSCDEAKTKFDTDPRQELYKQYLKIIATHSPAVFVMENVRGILSATVQGKRIFIKIVDDLRDPAKAVKEYGYPGTNPHKYHILSFVTGKEPIDCEDFLICAEKYGLPQARHRVILLGIREDIFSMPLNIKPLHPSSALSVANAIDDLPKLRSCFSGGSDTLECWCRHLTAFRHHECFEKLDSEIQQEIMKAELARQSALLQPCERHARYAFNKVPQLSHAWYGDNRLQYYLNHEARGHMDTDLWRYLFVSAFGKVKGTSPRLRDFPEALLPAHKNVIRDGHAGNQKFSDRFKVQLANIPSSTVTSHISKDGHYFIHPDVVQCRSLTVREAARLQTFPDNYFFEGNRTEQYHQVGNAVPPYLAKQLADVVRDIFRQMFSHQ